MSKSLRPFDPRRRVGTVTHVLPDAVFVNLSGETQQSGRLLDGFTLSGGQVGDFVVIDADTVAIFARVLEVKLPQRERLDIETEMGRPVDPHPVAKLHLLGTLSLHDQCVICGIMRYPTLGSAVYAADTSLVAHFGSSLSHTDQGAGAELGLNIGHVRDAARTPVQLNAKHLLGRHCAVLGTTGGGKSTTVARIIEQAVTWWPKIMLLDPTGEYPPIGNKCHSVVLGARKTKTPGEHEVHIPYSELDETDFYALFAPAGKTQGPKLREAIRNLRLFHIVSQPLNSKWLQAFEQDGLISSDEPGVLQTWNNSKLNWRKACQAFSEHIENPRAPFAVANLCAQILQECVHPEAFQAGAYGKKDATKWGGRDDSAYTYCLSLITRITGLLRSSELRPLFTSANSKSLFVEIDQFLQSDQQVLKVALDRVPSDFSAREILVHLIGKNLLQRARNDEFRQSRPVLVVLDEAHNFLNKSLGDEDFSHSLDAFEKLAKEGRKYWLNLLLATQQPRDIPSGVLSQMGTLIVHRLINEADRNVVESACGQLDAAAAKFLPSLAPGEAAIIGVDFPIPLTIQITQPAKTNQPNSQGPDFALWLKQPAPKPLATVPIAPPLSSSSAPTELVQHTQPASGTDEDDIPF